MQSPGGRQSRDPELQPQGKSFSLHKKGLGYWDPDGEFPSHLQDARLQPYKESDNPG